jgi:hypothetical protein
LLAPSHGPMWGVPPSRRTGSSSPASAAPTASRGPGGIALLDHTTFDVLRAWESDRGPQFFAYDAWWHLNQNTLVSSEWG